MGTLPDHWEGEDVIITIEEEGADTVINYEGKISNLSFGGGTQSTEDVFLFGNKTINFAKPREKFTVSFDFITAGTDFDQLNFGGSTGANQEIRSSAITKRYRIIIWFQPGDNHLKGAGDIVVPDKVGPIYRWIFTDCKSIELTDEFSADDMLKGTINFEFSATDSSGFANLFREYTNSQSTTSLTVLNATAHKGTLTWSATTTRSWTGSYRT